MLIAGIGCRRDCPEADILRAVRRAAALLGAMPDALATPDFKQDEAGLWQAAKTLGLELRLVSMTNLLAAQTYCITFSAPAENTTGIGSVAEGAALAAVGPGGVLRLPRIIEGAATCALAGLA